MTIKLEAKRLATVKQIPILYPAFKESTLRWLIFQNSNGLTRCIRRLGRKILIDLDQFEQWIDEQQGGAK